MNRSEHAAKIVVEATILGSAMRFRHEQSQGQHDFDLALPDGSTVPLEVTTAANPQVTAMVAAIGDRRKGGSFVQRSHAKSDWWIHPAIGANINRIRGDVDRYLAAIEREELSKFSADTGWAESEAVGRIYLDLRVEAGTVLQWNPPGRIGIAQPGQGTYVSVDHVHDAVRQEAWKDDNRRKLGSVVAREQHLFVFIDPRRFDAWMGLTNSAPPSVPPSLPPEVTDVWVATAIERAFVAWRGTPHRWLALAPIPIPAERFRIDASV